MITRRPLLAGTLTTGALAMSATPARATTLNARLDTAVAAGDLPGLHAVIATRNGETILERYFPGPDWRWGQSLGRIDFTAETRHDLRSVSKSIVGLLYGIALAQHLVPTPDTPLLDAFPAYADLATPDRRRLTIGHVLSMTLGVEWNENVPYTSAANSEIAMEMAPDRYRFILSRPIVSAPGERWIYTGGATALLGHLIARGTGLTLHEAARKYLFAPLGITDSEWIDGSNAEPAAASGLRLRAPDLARIGQCLLDGGRGIIPADWLKASFTPHTRIDAEVDYGYQWYLYNGSTGGAPWIGAIGNGGQRLVVIPRLGLVVAIFCGNYDSPEQATTPRKLLRDIILKAI
jgi:CubicO group peptidase (beta-lactamase class C family)